MGHGLGFHPIQIFFPKHDLLDGPLVGAGLLQPTLHIPKWKRFYDYKFLQPIKTRVYIDTKFYNKLKLIT